MTKENDFQKIADNTEETLDRVSLEIDGTMNALPVQKFENLMEITVNSTAATLTELLQTNLERTKIESEERIYRGICARLSDFPPELGEKLMKKIASKEEWEKQENDGVKQILLKEETRTSVMRVLIENHNGTEPCKKAKTKDGDSPVPPFTINFSKNDFLSPPQLAGKRRPLYK